MPTKRFKVVAAPDHAQLEDRMNEVDYGDWFLLSIISHAGWLIATFEVNQGV